MTDKLTNRMETFKPMKITCILFLCTVALAMSFAAISTKEANILAVPTQENNNGQCSLPSLGERTCKFKCQSTGAIVVIHLERDSLYQQNLIQYSKKDYQTYDQVCRKSCNCNELK
jgi:hypothetical protein